MMNIMPTLLKLMRTLGQKAVVATRLLLALTVLSVSSHFNLAQAAFDESGVGARAPGLADAFVGVADDSSSIFYNPAGLGQLVRPEVSTQFGRVNVGLDDGSELGTTYLGFAHPIKGGKKGTLGFGYHDFKLTSFYNERMLMLGYGWKPKFQSLSEHGTLLMGATLKQLHREFVPNGFTANALNNAGFASDQQDPLFAQNGNSTDDLALDIGSLYRFGANKKFSAGFAITNLNRPDVSLAGDDDRAPLSTKLGLGYRPAWGVMSAEVRRTKRLAGKSDTEIALGAERRINFRELGALELRGGYAEGSREFKKVTAGISYLFGRAQVDYAFDIPIGNLADTQGSHRIGFSFRWGGQYEEEEETKVIIEDLLKSFESDPSAAHLILKRAYENRKIKAGEVALLLQMVMHLYTKDSKGMEMVGEDFMNLKNRGPLLDWSSLKTIVVQDVPEMDRDIVAEAMNMLSLGRPADTLAKLDEATPESQTTTLVSAIRLIALSNVSADLFRNNEIKLCITEVQKIRGIVPNDRVIEKGYNDLLAMLPKEEPELPAAPAVLTAPTPVVVSTPVVNPMSEFDALLKEFREDLGHYFTRKEEGASLTERKHLLESMLDKYSDSGIDMSLVNRELTEVNAEIAALKKPAPKPVVIPDPIPEPVQEPEPKPEPEVVEEPRATDAELEQSWSFYKRALQRGLTDHERIEILESIIDQHGRVDRVVKELSRLRKRIIQE